MFNFEQNHSAKQVKKQSKYIKFKWLKRKNNKITKLSNFVDTVPWCVLCFVVEKVCEQMFQTTPSPSSLLGTNLLTDGKTKNLKQDGKVWKENGAKF